MGRGRRAERGEGGAFLNDIDVPRDRFHSKALSTIGAEADERLDLPVNVTRLGREEWEAVEPSAFVSTLRSRPIVDVLTGEVHD